MGEVIKGYFQSAQAIARNAYISRNKLDLALSGLELFFTAYGEGIFPQSTPAQIEGQRLHKAILEPFEWNRTRFVHRFPDLRSKEAQEWLRRVERENPGAVVMTPAEDLRYQRIVDRVMSHPLAGQLIRSAKTELHGYATCTRTGATLYSRPDIITPQGWIGDLKFTRNVDAFHFCREAYKERYFMQLAFYNHVHFLITGEQLVGNCFWVAVEYNYPHRVRVHTMPSDFQKMGDVLWNEGLDKILACLKVDPEMKNYAVWRAEGNGAGELELEPWMVTQDQRFVDAIAIGG